MARKARGRQDSLGHPARAVRAAALLIVAVGALVYANSFTGVFLFDDVGNITLNPAIRSLWPPWRFVLEPGPMGLERRPVVTLTLALNYAVSGPGVWSYHLTNLLIHVLAGLTLFGIVRRTLLSERLRARYGGAATGLALASALLWVAHPLQTESVTYVIQRCESLMGLFFLLTLYCAIRGWEGPSGRRWQAAAVAACLLGAGCKEVIVAAPFLVLAYGVLFVHGGVRASVRGSRWLYAGLLVSLLPLAGKAADTGWKMLFPQATGAAARPLATVVGVHNFTPLTYGLTQTQVILHYLRLSLWPDVLVLDYGWPVATVREALPCLAVIAVLLCLSAWALVRRHPAGFLGAWFFVVLAPTSSVARLPNAAFEHRMYLSLAALAVLAVLGGYRASRWLAGPGTIRERLATRGAAALMLAAALALGVRTACRNADYQDEVRLWRKNVQVRPQNARACYNLGAALGARGDYAESIPAYQEAIRLAPHYEKVHVNLGNALVRTGKAQEGIVHLREALRLLPDDADGHYDLGVALEQVGRSLEAIAEYREALRINPGHSWAHLALATVLGKTGSTQEAIAHCEQALRLDPGCAEARAQLAALRHQRRKP